jgi:hypothetical protein
MVTILLADILNDNLRNISDTNNRRSIQLVLVISVDFYPFNDYLYFSKNLFEEKIFSADTNIDFHLASIFTVSHDNTIATNAHLKIDTTGYFFL